jgi:hypothetical protein
MKSGKFSGAGAGGLRMYRKWGVSGAVGEECFGCRVIEYFQERVGEEFKGAV